MRIFKMTLVVCTAFLLMSASSCQNDKYPDLGDGLYAEIVTNKGTMVAKLFYEKVPLTVANFVALAEGNHPQVEAKYKDKPFFNGLTFHRVMDQFMIQGGDPLGNGMGNPGYRWPSEFHPTLLHDKPGILSMANSGGLRTNGSQFFITEVPYPSLNAYDADGNLKPCDQPRVSCHSVFGELVSGLEVQDSISNVKTAQGNKPVEDVIIEEINIIRQGFDARKFDAVATWNTELPKVDENLKKQQEEAREKAEAERKMMEEKKQAAAAEMLPKINEYKSKAKASPTGLMTYTITKGSGVKPKTGQTVKVNYQGYLTNGKLFDSNIKEVEEKYGMLNEQKVQRNMYNPTPMQVSPDAGLIAGFKEAMASMRIGDKVFAYIPAHLAWGERGSPPVIPADADVVFIIEFVEMAN